MPPVRRRRNAGGQRPSFKNKIVLNSEGEERRSPSSTEEETTEVDFIEEKKFTDWGEKYLVYNKESTTGTWICKQILEEEYPEMLKEFEKAWEKRHSPLEEFAKNKAEAD